MGSFGALGVAGNMLLVVNEGGEGQSAMHSEIDVA